MIPEFMKTRRYMVSVTLR